LLSDVSFVFNIPTCKEVKFSTEQTQLHYANEFLYTSEVYVPKFGLFTPVFSMYSIYKIPNPRRFMLCNLL